MSEVAAGVAWEVVFGQEERLVALWVPWPDVGEHLYYGLLNEVVEFVAI